MMCSLDLTIQVLGLSPKATIEELNTFFSYCGTVDKIQLHRNKDLSQKALVTFTQPYAFQTALLLNNAVFAGQQIRTLPAKDSADSLISDELTNDTKMHGFILPAMQEIASRSSEVLKKTKEEIEEKYKLSERGRLLMEQTRSLVCDAKQAAQHIGAKIVNHDYTSTAANWCSSALYKANLLTKKRDNPNSRKKK